MRKLLLLCLVLVEFQLCAQEGKKMVIGGASIDSLLRQLPNAKDDTNKVNLLSEIALVYRKYNTDQSIKYGQQTLILAQSLEWEKGIAEAYNILGYTYLIKSNYSSAIEYFEKGLGVYGDSKKGVGYINTLINLGEVYYRLSDYPKALGYYLKASKIAEDNGRKNERAACLMSIGNIYKSQGNLKSALEYHMEALKIYKIAVNKAGIVNAFTNIGNCYYDDNNLQLAKGYYEEALKIAEELGDKKSTAENLSNIGNVYSEENENAEALEYQFKALKIYEEIGNRSFIANIQGNIGTTYLVIANDTSHDIRSNGFVLEGKVANLHKAIEHLVFAIAIEKEIGELKTLQQFQENLSEAYALAGDYKLAFESHKDFTTIKDSVFSTQNTLKVANLVAQKDLEVKNKEIQLSNLKFIFSVGAICLLLLLVAIVFRNFRKQKGTNKLLMTTNTLLSVEQRKSDELLLNILPAEIANELKMNKFAQARQFEQVTVMFTDFVNFTVAGEKMTPQALVAELDECFKGFDMIIDGFRIEKIKTIGDAYLAVSGLPIANSSHASDIVAAAIKIRNFMNQRKAKLGDSTFQVRIGIHTGSVVAGIVGVKKFAYDIWGDTVNTAARMEQKSLAGKINISQSTWEIIKDDYNCEYRGKIEAKNKGMIDMYFVNS